jgi:hypothetical protein
MIAFFASCSCRGSATESRSSSAASNSRLQTATEVAEEEEVALSFMTFSVPNRALLDRPLANARNWLLEMVPRISVLLIYRLFACAEINRVFTVVTAGNPRFQPPARPLGERSQARLRSSPPIDHYCIHIPVSRADLDGTPKAESFRENRRNIRITGRVSAMVVVQCSEQSQ